MSSETKEHHIVGYQTYFLIWLGLLGLTGLTVAIAGLDFGSWNIAIALAVASVKTTLVALFFMHLRYEDKVFSCMVGMALFTVVFILVFIFLDMPFRN